MNLSAYFRRATLAVLPATMLLAACSKTDTPVTPPPAVDTGKVNFVNAASHIPGATLKFSVENSEKASLTYGSNSGYQGVQTGSRVVVVNSGTQVVLTQPAATIDKDRNYTFVATSAASSAVVGGQFFSDDLTPPTDATKARIRIINVAQAVTNPIRLSQVTTTAGGPVVVTIVGNTAGNSASAFTDFTPGDYALSILDNTGTAKAQLGSGTGAGTGTKLFQAGKLYTVIVSGTADSADPAQTLKAFLIQNN
jgi:hypothetical protein